MGDIGLSGGMSLSHRSWTSICLRRYGQPQAPQRKVVHIRLRQDVRKEGIHQHRPFYVPNRRYGSNRSGQICSFELPLNREHHGCSET